MKKSQMVSLVLVSGILGCSKPHKQTRLYLRTDTTTSYYTPVSPAYHGYYAFRPIGTWYNGNYQRQGYSSEGVAVSEESVTRGGFGGSEGFHASS